VTLVLTAQFHTDDIELHRGRTENAHLSSTTWDFGGLLFISDIHRRKDGAKEERGWLGDYHSSPAVSNKRTSHDTVLGEHRSFHTVRGDVIRQPELERACSERPKGNEGLSGQKL
jgi:hypothetical protein